MYKTILHPTDLSGNHFHMCEQAVAIARCFQAKLYLLHVIEPPASLQLAQGLGFAEFDRPIKDDAIAVMNVLGDALNIPENQLFVEIGSVKMHVLEKAAELGCDLIMLGSHTPNKFSVFLGSTAHAVLHQAKCDVLTLRNNQ